jgi:hypothetical protein
MTIIKKNLLKFISNQNINVALILASFLSAIYLGWSSESAMALAVLVYLILYDIKAKVYRNMALIFSLLAAVSLALGRQQIAEKMEAVALVSLIVYLFSAVIKIRGNDVAETIKRTKSRK